MNRYEDMGAWSNGSGGKRVSITGLRTPIRKADERATGGDGRGIRLTPQQINNFIANRGNK